MDFKINDESQEFASVSSFAKNSVDRLFSKLNQDLDRKSRISFKSCKSTCQFKDVHSANKMCGSKMCLNKSLYF